MTRLARGQIGRALRSHLLAAICTNADRSARAPLAARRRPQRRTRSMHHAAPATSSGKPPAQLTNTETRDRKRWSRSKLGQPAAIYTRPGRRISLSAGAIPLSGTPLFGANPMATLAANNNKVPANTTAWKGTGTTRTDLSQYVLSRARGAVRNQTRSIRSQEQRQTRTLRKRAPAMWRESGSERKTIVV